MPNAKFETCQHAECISSTNSLHRLCQTKHEEHNDADGEMNKYCKECFVKKHNTRAVVDLEGSNSSDTNNTNSEVTNEGIVTIADEQRCFEGLDTPMLLHCDEGNAAITEKICVILQNKCYELNVSTIQGLEHLEEMGKNYSTRNYINSDDVLENFFITIIST